MISEYVIQGPVNTEKAFAAQQNGLYTFWIHKDATKVDVKIAFNTLYSRAVDTVRVSSLPKKTRVVGRGKIMTKRQERRKAFVTFKDSAPFEVVAVQSV